MLTTDDSNETRERTALRDMEWMSRIQAKDEEALAELYDQYGGIVKSLVLKVVHNEAEADDLLQEIFFEIWNQAANYNREKGRPLAWIVTLARRRAIDRLRKRQALARAEERLLNEPEQQPDAWVSNTLDEDLAMNDAGRMLRDVMSALPEAQRQAIHLAYFKGMSQREMATATGIPLGTIKTRLELGLKKIAEALKGMKDEF